MRLCNECFSNRALHWTILRDYLKNKLTSWTVRCGMIQWHYNQNPILHNREKNNKQCNRYPVPCMIRSNIGFSHLEDGLVRSDRNFFLKRAIDREDSKRKVHSFIHSRNGTRFRIGSGDSRNDFFLTIRFCSAISVINLRGNVLKT